MNTFTKIITVLALTSFCFAAEEDLIHIKHQSPIRGKDIVQIQPTDMQIINQNSGNLPETKIQDNYWHQYCLDPLSVYLSKRNCPEDFIEKFCVPCTTNSISGLCIIITMRLCGC
ncbi:MAG: hypothetical protein ACK4V2_00450 [Pseudomonadota bacterium]|jgi:hypothetical protein|nr:hypothetical protein [Alphaproteobacteria bacterium]